jgi:adenosine deaminase
MVVMVLPIVRASRALVNEAGFSLGELAQLARNGWAVADVPGALRQKWLAEIDRLTMVMTG